MRKERLVCTCMIFHFATHCENCSLDLPVVVAFPLAVSLRASISSKRPLPYPHDHPHSHHRRPRHKDTHMREKNLPNPNRAHSLTQEEGNLSPFHTKKPSSSSLTTGSGLTSSASLFFFLLLLTRVLIRFATGVRTSSSFSCSCSSSSESPALALRALVFLVAEAEAEPGVDGRLRLVPLVGVCVCEIEKEQ